MAVIAIDWDHTLMNGKEWLPGAKDALKLMREKGHKVIIYSCNSEQWIEQNLLDAGIIVDHVWIERGKPLADIYIDDKGYRFPSDGDWTHEINPILLMVGELDNRKW